ncbi:MAG: hypothetical protein A2W19_09575 [Spirochaetes bacterium RBG_16_49_21]|nr:MAG: hypothetical protein A2W19_09575 [Spirochaetes bacterium RBG_16_49_21]
MFKKLIFSVCFGGLVVLLATGAMAFGIGGYMTLGGGSTSHDYGKYEYFAAGQMKESSDFAIGGGLIMDSNLAYDRVFNWRMKIGGEQLKVDREAEMKLTRLHMNHLFGFGIVRTKVVRLWLGPRIGISYSSGNRTDFRDYAGISPVDPVLQIITLGFYSPSILQYPILRDKITKIQYGGIDVGLALGLNINIGEYVTIGPEFGFKYALNWGFQKREIYISLLDGPIMYIHFLPLNLNNERERLTLSGYEIYATIAAMFRVGGDSYGGR